MNTYSRILILCIILCSGCGVLSNPVLVEKGVLNLRNYNLSEQEPVKLQGDWEFYWEELYTPEDFVNFPNAVIYREFPKLWDGHKENGVTITGCGFATYRLRILLRPQEKHLAIKIPTTGTTAKLFVNGEEKIEIGKIGVNEDTSEPMFNPVVMDIDNHNGELELVLQISNFDYKKGGPWKNFLLGDEDKLRKLHEKSVFFDFFLLGAFAIIGLYFIGLFVLRKKERFHLWFGIGAIASGLRVAASGEYIISFLDFPTYEMIIGTELFSFYSGIGILITYLHSIFPKEFNKYVLYSIQGLSITFAGLVLFTPAIVYSHTVNFYQFFTVGVLLYSCFIVGRAIFNKRSGSILFAIGFFILVLFILNDILLNFQANYDIHLTGLGFFTFMLIQSYLVSYRFTSTFNDNERLSIELNKANQYLERRVEDRTQELNDSLEELKLIQKEIEKANQALEKSNIAKDKLFSIIGHDLRGPMNSIRVSMEYLLEDFEEMSKEEIKSDMGILYRASGSAIALLNNLFEWAKTQTGAIRIVEEEFSVVSSVENAVELLNEKPKEEKHTHRNRI